MITPRDKRILHHINMYGGITARQCYLMFFKNAKYGNDLARKRLKQLSEWGECKCFTPKNLITQEYVYCDNKAISAHTIYLMNFYATLIYFGAEILEFISEAKFTNCRADGFIKYRYNNNIYVSFLEVVIYKQVDYGKYEKLKDLGEVQEKYKIFPSVVVISDSPQKYKSSKLTVKYIDYEMREFHKYILS